MLHDRVLVQQDGSEGERRSTAGIVIPATASMGRRLSWATAVGVGPNVRSIVVGDRVSLADVTLVAYTRVAPEGGFDLTGYPRVQAWIGRVETALKIA